MILLPPLPAAFYTCDETGALFQFNEKAANLFGGRLRAGVTNEPFGAAVAVYYSDGTQVPAAELPLARCLAKGEPVTDLELTIERADNTKINVCINVEPARDAAGNVIGAIAIMEDLAIKGELRNSNKALRASEERYHKMIDEVEDYAILLLNKDGIIQNWNKGAEKIKGYRENEIIGRHFRVFYLPEDQAKLLPEQLIARASKEGKALHEGWRVRKDKTVFWGSIVITALHDADNQIIGFSKVTRDLTERKRAEDELAHQNQELQRFAYVAAHDMKEPLRKLHYYTSYIATHGGKTLPERDKDYLARASASALRMQALIDDLLAYSKTTDYSNAFELVDLNKVLEDAKLLHQDTIEETAARINADALPEIMAIPFQMVQLFDNLLGNALKYRHPDRQPAIHITAEQTNVLPGPEAAYARRQQFHCIRVSDNGIGFQPGESAKIFNVFERLHDRSDYAGNGIGLAICKKIVQNHKGYIFATGSPGIGAAFSVFIPAT